MKQFNYTIYTHEKILNLTFLGLVHKAGVGGVPAHVHEHTEGRHCRQRDQGALSRNELPGEWSLGQNPLTIQSGALVVRKSILLDSGSFLNLTL